jgi:peptidyl-prolyl cis-trans isomerase B (cyclophilin B)
MHFVRLGVLIAIMAIIATPLARAQGNVAKAPAGAGPIIVVETEKGTFEFETYPNEAPKTVARILELIRKRFYNGHRFHRVIPGFVIQIGDPSTRDMTKKDAWGRGGSGTPIGIGEFSKLRTHVRGAVGMAHLDDPAKADSQFYVTLAPAPQLDGKYTVFGKVISGMDVVTKIAFADRLVRATVKGEK